jgi:hypothetical protein
VVLGQVDDFENGTTMGWAEGGVSPNPPTNVATGGPAGLNDNFLQNVSSGSSGAGGRMIMFNNAQWTGDFVAAGVTRVDAMVRASGVPMSLRIGLSNSSGDIFVSDPAFALLNNGAWTAASFDLTAGAMTRVQGIGSLTDVLSDVFEMRILSAASPSWLGDPINAILSVDNIVAAPEPNALALLGLGALLLNRRR